MKKHKEKKAAKVLARIYQTDEKGIEDELSDIEASVVKSEREHFWQKLKWFYSWKFIQRSAAAQHVVMWQPYHIRSLYSTFYISIPQGGFGNVVAGLQSCRRWYSNFVSWSYLLYHHAVETPSQMQTPHCFIEQTGFTVLSVP